MLFLDPPKGGHEYPSLVKKKTSWSGKTLFRRGGPPPPPPNIKNVLLGGGTPPCNFVPLGRARGLPPPQFCSSGGDPPP